MHSLALSLLLAAGGSVRAAVEPFAGAGGADPSGGVVLSERLAARLSGAGGLVIVERARLTELRKEREPRTEPAHDVALFDALLEHLHLCDLQDCHESRDVAVRAWLEAAVREDAVVAMRSLEFERAPDKSDLPGPDAVVTGDFMPLAAGRAELHARLIDQRSARVLGLVSGQVDMEWTVTSPPKPDLASAGAAGPRRGSWGPCCGSSRARRRGSSAPCGLDARSSPGGPGKEALARLFRVRGAAGRARPRACRPGR